MSRPHEPAAQVIRFIIAGGFNTLITGIALSLLAIIIDPVIAYTLVFMAGIALSVTLTANFVFKSQPTWRRVTAFVVMYLIVYLAGLGVIALLRRWWDTPYLSGLVVLVTAPLSFLGGRFIFGASRSPSSPPVD